MAIKRSSWAAEAAHRFFTVCPRRSEGRCVNPMLPEKHDVPSDQHCVPQTHQIGAHGALCQHESTFRHQEYLNVGKTRGLLLIVILLRVVVAAPLCADLVFNLHPSAQAPVRLDGMKLNGSGPAEGIWLWWWWRAALQKKCEPAVRSPSKLKYTARNPAVHSAVRTVRQRPLFTACPVSAYRLHHI